MTPRWPVLCILIACPGPPPTPRSDTCLVPAKATIQTRWPNARAALEAEEVYGRAVWYWAHKRASIDGYGVTLATLTHRPGLLSAFDPPTDLPASGRVDEPSLLFFDQQGDDPEDWPLIGMGWFMPFDPCVRPLLQCSLPEDFFVHEAGYHRVPFGDGGMDVATEADVRNGVSFDPEGCAPLEGEDLRPELGSVRHGRSWVTHVWFSPDPEEPPIWAAEDPWARWEDATERATVEGTPFYSQGDCEQCIPADDRPGGCGG